MADHLNNAVRLFLDLDPASLSRAARLGGLPIGLDESLIDDPETSLEVVCHFAKLGIELAIYESFDRLYPLHYPDDITDIESLERDSVGYCWGHVWRGTPKW